ncbi:MAG: copper-binding protein, partial [Chloroflexota bacterium]
QEPAPQAPTNPFLVRLEDNVFIPKELAVPPGTTVTWLNAGADDHTIVATDLSFDSGVIKPGQSWQRLFEAPGEYPYICDLHEGMEGKIIVQ